MSIWLEHKKAPTHSSDIGIVVIQWKNAPDDRIQDIISSLYKDNEDVIEGMTYREYDSSCIERIKKVHDFIMGKVEEKKEKVKQMTLFQ